MNGAIFALLVNIGVAVLFAAAFAVVAATYRQQRAALWFCASYMMGMLTPASEVLIHFTGVKTPFMISSYVCFLASQLLMVAGLTVLYGRRPRWGVIATIFAVGMVVRAVIWGGTRSTLPYEMVFQFPWVVISLLMCVTIVQGERLKKLDYALAFTFQLIALHFMLKPFLSVAFGSGAAARDYTGSAYALYSQATSGMMLVGAGLLLLLIVVQKAVAQWERDAETDPLAQIANRRGFEREAESALVRAGRHGQPVSAVIFDLDHFKAINDRHGHAVGDTVIAAFAALLQRSAPQAAIVARIGGEEFAMLIERSTAETAWLNAEAIRVATAGLAAAGLPPVSVSGGVAEWRPGETLAELIRRADHACYRVKNGGRDRICHAPRDGEVLDRANVVSLGPQRR